ncbi:complex I intermediate-associated protein 30 [Xylocopa sonorina]|uniref:complex I intermediate-associated protein 30 n=1 Tax=Xylocopa sonorina TaxID=1818115 RepID=UPI00403A9FDD
MFRTLKPHKTASLVIKRTIYEHHNAGYSPVYHKPPEQLTFLQRLRRACSEFKDEYKLFKQELRSSYGLHSTIVPPYEHDIVWKFDGTQKSLDRWIVNSDKDYNHGYSIANLELSPTGTGIFYGTLDTRIPKDGRTIRSGYCNITTVPKLKSFKRPDKYDWFDYNELVLRVRGDGRCYMLNILQRGFVDILWYNCYNYVMYTRGGPYWQTVNIPFSKFLFSTKGEIHENQCPMPENLITNFGITLADKKPGPFRLEIDYIGVCYNPNIFESFAYETYKIERD